MTKLVDIDNVGAALTLLIVFTIFLGSGIIGINVGPIFLFPLRTLSIIAIPFVLLSLHKRKFRLLRIFLFSLFIYGCLAGLIMSNENFIEQLSVLQIGLTISIMLISYINTTERLKKFFSLWVIGCMLVNIVSLMEMFTGSFIFNEMERGASFLQGMGFLRPISIYTNSNNLAFFNCISAVFILIVIINKESFSNSIVRFAYFTFFITILALIFSFSRAAILSLFFIFFYYICYQAYYNRSIKLLFNVLTYISISFVLGIIFIPTLLDTLTNIYVLFLNKLISSGEGGGDELRLEFFRVSLNKLANNYGLGGGPGYSWNDYHNNKGVVGPHNFFLEIMVDYGIWALVGFIVIIVGIFYHFNKGNISKSKILLSGSIFAFVLLTFSVGSTIGAPAFWVWFGVINLFKHIDFK